MKITKITIISLVVFIAFMDIALVLWGGSEATISHQIIEWSYAFPAIPFLFGFLMGHLFWRMKDTEMTGRVSKGNKNGF